MTRPPLLVLAPIVAAVPAFFAVAVHLPDFYWWIYTDHHFLPDFMLTEANFFGSLFVGILLLLCALAVADLGERVK